MGEVRPEPEPDGRPLATRTLRGMFWAYGSYALGRLLVLLSIAVLARLLSPDEFGLVALALIFTGIMETIKDLGVSQALVVSDETDVRERADTAFAFSLGMGVLLSLLCAAASPLAASLFDEPELTRLLPILGLNFTLRALGSTHYALAQRNIDFRSRTAGELADVVIRGATGVGLALAGAGAYSLVLGYLAGTTAMTFALWLMVDWRPTLRAGYEHIGSLLRFGGSLTGLSITVAAIPLAQNTIIGRVLGATALGIYTLGLQLPGLLIVNLSLVAGEVLYPAFASVERERLGEVFLTAMHYTMMIALPMAAFVTVLAQPLILAAFGDQWRDSAPVMEILGLYALALTLGVPAGTAYKATGRAFVLLLMAVPRAIAAIVSVAIFVDDGLVAVATCQVVVAVVFDVLGIYVSTRLLKVSIGAVVRSILASVAAAAAMTGTLLLVDSSVSGSWPTIILGGVAGGAVYLAVLAAIARDSLSRLVRLSFAKGSG